MPKMTVGELKSALEDFGDHLPVVLATMDDECEEFTVEASNGPLGPCCVLESD